MKKLLIMLGVLAMISPVLATSITYSEGWEYSGGTTDPAYVAAWADNPAREAIATAYYRSGARSLLVDNGSSYGVKGQTHVLPTAVKGTDASPLVLSTYMVVQAAAHRQYLDFSLELANGNVVAPASGTANVVAIARSITLNGQNARFFAYDGDSWDDTGDAITTYSASGPGTGKYWKVQITVNSTQLLWALYDGAGALNASDTFPLASGVQGMFFDRINIRHPGAANAAVHVAYIDDLSLSGGEIIPEPATVVLLGLGLMLLRRRVT